MTQKKLGTLNSVGFKVAIKATGNTLKTPYFSKNRKLIFQNRSKFTKYLNNFTFIRESKFGTVKATTIHS